MPKKPASAIYGVLGFPLSHSLSPVMHNAAFRALKVRAIYQKFEVSASGLDDFIHSLGRLRIRGFNVTIPYKEKILQYLSGKASSAVAAIGAVNTVKVSAQGKLKGYNTDYLGFLKHLKDLGLKPKRIAIIGAGGAAKAVSFALIQSGAAEIAIHDIYKFKSTSLAQWFQVEFPGCRFAVSDTVEGLRLKEKDLLVNASPVGMKPDDPCLVREEMLAKGLFVYDLIYNPAETSLLKLAKSKGLSYANGLNMLLYQGAESFKIWLKPKKAPVEVMRRALAGALSRQ